MKKLSLLLLLICFSSLAFAYQLNGTMTQSDNGMYSVTLSDEEGHIFHGYGKDQDDDTLLVDVRDDVGVRYVGTAKLNGDEYDLDLLDSLTGDYATGTLDLE